jgi:SNF2 family DNA or RNA helicase
LARLDALDKLFLGLGTWDERFIFKEAGFRWNRFYRAWTTHDPEIAQSIQGLRWTNRAWDLLDEIEEVNDASLDLSYADDTLFEPPCPQGLNFLGYQKAGIEYALMRKDTLIGDQPGLGKTIQAIGVANCLKVARPRVLIICPASLKINWQREFIKWRTKNVTVGIAETQHRQKYQDGFYKNGKPKFKTVVHPEHWPDTDAVIINYDIVGRFLDRVHDVHWDLVVCDECHALKTTEALRTIFILGGSFKKKGERRQWFNAIDGKKRLFLSGTPMLNRPVEMWSFAKACDPAGLGKDWTNFTDRYCAGHEGFHGRDVSGSTNAKELGQKLRERFLIRRLKKEVLPDLPPKIRGVITLDTPEIREIVAREDELAQALRLYEKLANPDAGGEQVVDRMSQYGIRNEIDEDARWTRRIDLEYASAVLGLEPPAVAVLFEELAQVRRELGIAKLSGAIPWIKNTLDGGEKLLVFAYHSAVVEALYDGLRSYHPALVYGKTPVRKRQGQVDYFQERDECRVFIGNIDAAGVGLTLTKASDVAFAEIDWVPAKLEQCEDRACRIGQTAEKIFSSFLVANGSLDARIAQSAYLKEENISAVLDT